MLSVPLKGGRINIEESANAIPELILEERQVHHQTILTVPDIDSMPNPESRLQETS